jgi:hypothetical protein
MAARASSAREEQERGEGERGARDGTAAWPAVSGRLRPSRGSPWPSATIAGFAGTRAAVPGQERRQRAQGFVAVKEELGEWHALGVATVENWTCSCSQTSLPSCAKQASSQIVLTSASCAEVQERSLPSPLLFPF